MAARSPAHVAPMPAARALPASRGGAAPHPIADVATHASTARSGTAAGGVAAAAKPRVRLRERVLACVVSRREPDFDGVATADIVAAIAADSGIQPEAALVETILHASDLVYEARPQIWKPMP